MVRSTYAELGDSCMTAHAMELVGGRWTYPIYRELVLGPKRFSDLLDCVRGITPAVLTARLRAMQASGLVQPQALVESASSHAYALTPWALDLAPVLRELGRWAAGSPLRPDQGGLTPDAAVQAMVTIAGDHSLMPGIEAELHLVDSRVEGSEFSAYTIRWDDKGLAARRAPSPNSQVTIRVDSTQWGRVLFTAADLQHSGAETSGDVAIALRLVEEFQSVLRAA